MRVAVFALIALSGCTTAEEPQSTDVAATSSCARTSCVEGASCTLPTGGTCRCFTVGEWTCGEGSTPPRDGGSLFDTGLRFDTGTRDSAFVAPPVDSGAFGLSYDYPYPAGGCSSFVSACGDPASVENARNALSSMMTKCGMACSRLLLYAYPNGCAQRIELGYEWTASNFECLQPIVDDYQWPCVKLLVVEKGGCPE